MQNEQIKQKIPVGMIILLVFIGYSLMSLIFAFTKFSPMVQLGLVLLSGAGAIVEYVIIVVILVAIFLGIFKRFKWARILAIAYYIFSMVLTLTNALAFSANTTMYDSYYQKALSPQMLAVMTPTIVKASLISGAVFAWIIGLVVIIYLLRKKNFFVN